MSIKGGNFDVCHIIMDFFDNFKELDKQAITITNKCYTSAIVIALTIKLSICFLSTPRTCFEPAYATDGPHAREWR
jgi:hypothetical protein